MTAEKTKEKDFKKSMKTKIIDDVYEEYVEKQANDLNNTNALVKGADVENQLINIEKQLSEIVDKQKNGVSAEFNALMDGYVNKANESQEFKVKSQHLEGLYEELKIEAKTLKESNKKLKEDLEATKEALRMSESDIKRLKIESETAKTNYKDQINNADEERDTLKSKLKELQLQNDQNIQNYNNIKSELLEQKYKVKQFEQEKQVEEETQKRTTRETSKLIEELKEKLELRTREVEYKDALLNQLIKQVSVEDNFQSKMSPDFMNKENSPNAAFDHKEMHQESPEEKPMNLRQTLASRFSKKTTLNDKQSSSSSWGPFKKK